MNEKDGHNPACHIIPPHVMLAEGWLPLNADDGTVEILSSHDLNSQVTNSVRSWFPDYEVRIKNIEEAELQEHILDRHKQEIADFIANDLHRKYPELSAKSGTTTAQKACGILILIASIALYVVSPRVISFVLSIIFLSWALLVAALSVVASLPKAWFDYHDISDPRQVLQLAEDALPLYTILIPLYDEASMVPHLIGSLSALDYDSDRLEVLLLVEAKDFSTSDALKAAELKPYMRIVKVPVGRPQTKPRACNLGLLIAKGDLIVIYDAEDRPEPDQLLKSAARFAAGDNRLACVQAKLAIDNASRNFLTYQSALDYAVRYELILKGQVRLGLPVPLRGTSNHFRTEVLRQVGGWDSWNVTEDADLGIRCKALGYDVDMIDAATWEESTSSLRTWIPQHTRWLKGWMVTVLVYTKDPFTLPRRLGLKGIITLLGFLAAAPL